MQRKFDFDATVKRGHCSSSLESVGAQTIRPVVVQDRKQAVVLSSATEAKNVRKKTQASMIAELRERIDAIGWRCELSGAKLNPDMFSLDHIVPLAHGGTHDAGNIQFVHPVINAMKGTLSVQEFVGWCKLVAENLS